jgi:hypothetical protein
MTELERTLTVQRDALGATLRDLLDGADLAASEQERSYVAARHTLESVFGPINPALLAPRMVAYDYNGRG